MGAPLIHNGVLIGLITNDHHINNIPNKLFDISLRIYFHFDQIKNFIKNEILIKFDTFKCIDFDTTQNFSYTYNQYDVIRI